MARGQRVPGLPRLHRAPGGSRYRSRRLGRVHDQEPGSWPIEHPRSAGQAPRPTSPHHRRPDSRIPSGSHHHHAQLAIGDLGLLSYAGPQPTAPVRARRAPLSPAHSAHTNSPFNNSKFHIKFWGFGPRLIQPARTYTGRGRVVPWRQTGHVHAGNSSASVWGRSGLASAGTSAPRGAYARCTMHVGARAVPPVALTSSRRRGVLAALA